jgi:hypothetical protein
MSLGFFKKSLLSSRYVRGIQKANQRLSIRGEVLIDIYASTEVNGLAILIDRPFQKKLEKLELDMKDKHLIFVFDAEKKDLGVPLKDDLVPFFLEREHIKFNIMDKQTLTLQESFMVPLNILNAPK